MPFPLVTPSTMMLVAFPRIFGAITSSVTLAIARIRTAATPSPSGASRAASRRVEFLKSLERSSGIPAAPNRPIWPPPRRSSGGLTVSASSCSSSPVVVERVVAHAASSSVSCDATISA